MQGRFAGLPEGAHFTSRPPTGTTIVPPQNFTITDLGGDGNAGNKPEALRRAAFAGFVPNKVVLYRPAGVSPRITALAPFTKTQTSQSGKATAYVCRNYQCQLPTRDPKAVSRMLSKQ